MECIDERSAKGFGGQITKTCAQLLAVRDERFKSRGDVKTGTNYGGRSVFLEGELVIVDKNNFS